MQSVTATIPQVGDGLFLWRLGTPTQPLRSVGPHPRPRFLWRLGTPTQPRFLWRLGATHCATMSGVQDLGSAAALLLAAVFAWAGAVKLVSPARTATSFRDLGLPIPAFLGRAVPLFELSTATLLVLAPRAGAALALGALAIFSGVVLNALRNGKHLGCGCFGASNAAEDLSYVEPVRNLLLALAAATAVMSPDLTRPTLAAIVAVTSAAVAAALGLGLLRLRQRVGVVWSTPLPGSIPSR